MEAIHGLQIYALILLLSKLNYRTIC